MNISDPKALLEDTEQIFGAMVIARKTLVDGGWTAENAENIVATTYLSAFAAETHYKLHHQPVDLAPERALEGREAGPSEAMRAKMVRDLAERLGVPESSISVVAVSPDSLARARAEAEAARDRTGEHSFGFTVDKDSPGYEELRKLFDLDGPFDPEQDL